MRRLSSNYGSWACTGSVRASKTIRGGWGEYLCYPRHGEGMSDGWNKWEDRMEVQIRGRPLRSKYVKWKCRFVQAYYTSHSGSRLLIDLARHRKWSRCLCIQLGRLMYCLDWGCYIHCSRSASARILYSIWMLQGRFLVIPRQYDECSCSTSRLNLKTRDRVQHYEHFWSTVHLTLTTTIEDDIHISIDNDINHQFLEFSVHSVYDINTCGRGLSLTTSIGDEYRKESKCILIFIQKTTKVGLHR